MSYKLPSSTTTEPGLIVLAGDLGGTATSPVVNSIQGNSLNLGSLGATQDGYVLTWTNSSSQWQARAPGSTIAQGIDYQFSNSSSDIGGYSKLLDVASGSQGDLSTAVTSGGGKTLIKAFATPSNLPGISVIPAGLWEFNYYGYASLTGAFTTQLVFDVYTRTAGGAETLLFSVTGSNLNVTSVSRFTISFNVTTDTYIDDTQRLVIKVSAQTSNIISVTAHFVFDGTTNTSLVRTPISGDAIQLGGDLSGTTTSATVININGASVPAAGSLTTGNVLQVSGASALTYAAINLAGGNNFVTGNLPITNVAPGTSAQVLMSNGTPATTWTTLSSDVTVSATGVTTVNSISGSSPIAITPATLQWTTGTSSPTLTQASESTVTKGQDLTITPQQSTHTTDQGGGNLIVSLQTPTGAGAEAALKVTRGGSQLASIQPLFGTPTTGALYLSEGITPSATNYTIDSTSTSTTVNAPGAGQVFLAVQGTNSAGFTASLITLLAPTLQWFGTTSSPTINQAAAGSDVATQNLTITPQAPFASASTNKNPGNLLLNISSPIAGGTNGYVGFQQGGSTTVTMGVDPASTTYTGLFSGVPSSSNYLVMSNGTGTYFGAPSGSAIITSGGTGSTAQVAVQANGITAVSGKFQLQTNILNDGYFSANTQDATANVVVYTDSAIPSGSVYDFIVTIVGVSPGTTNVYRADYSFTYLNNAGSLLAIGASPVALNVRTNGTGNTFATAIDASTTSVKVTVTGLSATSIDWGVSFNRSKIS